MSVGSVGGGAVAVAVAVAVADGAVAAAGAAVAVAVAVVDQARPGRKVRSSKVGTGSTVRYLDQQARQGGWWMVGAAAWCVGSELDADGAPVGAVRVGSGSCLCICRCKIGPGKRWMQFDMEFGASWLGQGRPGGEGDEDGRGQERRSQDSRKRSRRGPNAN